jgi:hypothetical protein
MIERNLRERLAYLLNEKQGRASDPSFDELDRKKQLFEKRNVEIVKAKMKVKLGENFFDDDGSNYVRYKVHTEYLCNDHDHLYMEEHVEERTAFFYGKMLIKDTKEAVPFHEPVRSEGMIMADSGRDDLGRSFTYDRLAAVQYAEKWWNKRNPAYKNFDDNCTNFISQCLQAGSAPMRGYPNRGSGWWMQKNSWSYSWTVAHSMKSFLGNSKVGLRAEKTTSPEELSFGDVICYDFDGDGRYNHTTIVVSKDKSGMPLVNAQTYDSRMRYWSYEDSTAYTPSIKYTFYKIIDDTSKQ